MERIGTSYSEYVTSMARQNPSLKTLSGFLHHQPRTTCNSIVSYVEIGVTGDVGLSRGISTVEFMAQVTSGLKKSIIAVMENIHPDDRVARFMS